MRQAPMTDMRVTRGSMDELGTPAIEAGTNPYSSRNNWSTIGDVMTGIRKEWKSNAG